MSEANSWVVDVGAQNFETEVIQRSRTLPVLVDFWATWCEPCKTLTPLLERAAAEGEGRFLLARVDVDKNPELAQAFRVQGVPSVLAIVDGKLADGFSGALPEDELTAFLDRIAPGGPATASPVGRARALVADGDADGAIECLRQHLREHAGDSKARLALAEILLEAGRGTEAGKVLAKLSADEAGSAEAKALAARIGFSESAGDLDQLRAAVSDNPEDAGGRIELGKALVAREAYADGLEELLEAVRIDPEYDGAAAKGAMLEVFDVLGLEDTVANDYRFKLSLELFS